MCGIAGFWQTKRGDHVPREVLASMGTALHHRGPDDSGTFFDASAGLGLSFRRLSILDLSPAGHQPMESASGRYVIIFNGEVYNFAAIKDELGPASRGEGTRTPRSCSKPWNAGAWKPPSSALSACLLLHF